MSQEIAKKVCSEVLSKWVVEGMLKKKAQDVVVMNLREVRNAVVDYFILCNGNSDSQIDAISESIEDQIHKKSKQKPWKREGQQNKEWVLLDYIDVVAHVFNKEKRIFYGLEDLWGDAKITRIDSNLNDIVVV